MRASGAGRLGQIRDRVLVPGSLSRRFAAASALTILGTVGTHVIRLASNLVLARLLVPDMFGLMVLAGTVYSAIELLTDTGIPLSIQREAGGDEPRFLRAAWTVSILRGLAVGFCTILCAIALGIFAPAFFRADSVYAQPEAPILLGLFAFLPVMKGLISSNLYLAMREMRLGRVTLLNISSQLLSMLCMAGFAWVWPSVWALASGMLLQMVLQLIASHTILPGPRMRWTWDRDVFARLWSFGKWLMISTPLGFLAANVDTFLLGGLFDSTTFGLYSIGRLWAMAWATLTGQFIRVVGLPGLSEVARNRPQDLTRVIRKMLRVVNAISLVSCLALTFGAQALIRFIYPENYLGAARFLEILALLLLSQHFNTLRTALLSTGHTKLIMVLALQNALATGLGISLAYRYFGVEAAVYTAVFGQFASAPSLIYFCARVLPNYRIGPDLFWVGIMGAVIAANFLWV